MPTPDLPAELWLEIIAHLSRGALHKMMGVNRTLFELAMDDIYEEVRFISIDEEMLRVFQQIQSRVVANRVRRFIIQPDFLPSLEEQTPVIRFWKILQTKPLRPNDPETSKAILSIAERAIPLCKNLQEIEIIVYDLSLTPSFNSFINSLWKADSVGLNLRSLLIKTTMVKIAPIIRPLIKSFKSLPKLENISLDISPSRKGLSPAEYDIAIGTLKSFFIAFKGNLKAIKLSSPPDLRRSLASLLGGTLAFPNLRKLEVLSVFTLEFQSISRCVTNHADTLEHLSIKLCYRNADNLNMGYGNWINPPANYHGSTLFRWITLPKLRTLKIALQESDRFALGTAIDARTFTILPNLSTFAPSITSIILSDLPLSFRRISDLVSGLSRGDILENLSLMATTLSPSLFDLFALKLPDLKTLTVDFIWTSDTECYTGGGYNTPHTHKLFLQTMQTHRYTKWPLQYLRLTTIDPACGASHPKPSIMRAVADSLPSGVQLDYSYACFCSKAFNDS
ncbi:hypothetical protein GALMADRAFT_228550 [Galerina marginata CBS 339.88]|uniref:F-box domain-containing protein n=1 Tax=Galerina marginata (strain CBS 339.88) TaxID=685588 RepID=A0A067SPJ1_GALM3|nr:hypothetical protein GALMADRAFT_228550 [Galerina marginata CBS 339.88]